MNANPGVRDIDVSRFFPQEGEWIVDNESGGFSIWQAATGDRTPGWLKPVSFADTYDTYNVMMASGVWSLVTHYGFYGRRVRSGWMKKCGDGESKVKWSVKIEKSGYYEVLVHIPKYVSLQRVKRLPGGFFVPSSISDRELKQNYIVRLMDRKRKFRRRSYRWRTGFLWDVFISHREKPRRADGSR